MSGVIDKRGQQWERCNICSDFTKMQHLGYDRPSDDYQFGRMVCRACYNRLSLDAQKNVQPPASWRIR